jgi:hypothetical protein
MLRVQAVVLIVICFSLVLWPQATPTTANPTKNSAHAKDPVAIGKKPSGSISGRVFAITRAGDLKPARLARVYLMGGLNIPPDSAVSIFLDKQLSGRTALRESGALTDDSEELLCRKELLLITDSVQAAVKWVEENKKYSEFLSAQADEEGTFQISGVAPGGYTLAVRGRAGENEAYWETDVFFVQVGGKMSWKVGANDFLPGKDVSIKLSSPEKVCFAPDE